MKSANFVVDITAGYSRPDQPPSLPSEAGHSSFFTTATLPSFWILVVSRSWFLR